MNASAPVPITAIVLTKDEEANIESCLASLSFAAEILVVDSGSTDRTVELAGKYTDRVVIRPWAGWSDQFNHAASVASHDWVFRVDADERVTPELAEEIRATLPETRAVAFRNSIREFMFGGWVDHGGWDRAQYIRLYRRDRGSWKGSVHETVQVDGPIGTLNAKMLHFSHLTVGRFVSKALLYTDLEANQRVALGRKPRLWRVLPRFLSALVGRYLCRGGWRDGERGFVVAFLLAFYYAMEEIQHWGSLQPPTPPRP